MQAKASQRQSSQAEQRAVQAQPGFAGQRRTGPDGRADALLSLQRSHGNRFVQRLLGASVLQRDCGCGGTRSGSSSKQVVQNGLSRFNDLHRKPAVQQESFSAPSIVDEVLSSPGRPLDASARAVMEPRFGRDFQHVRIHSDSKASESAKGVSALAYTVGPNIVFAAGQYSPASHEGRRLLAHELTHTVQQAGADPGPISGISYPGDASEREADRVAESVMRMTDPAPSIAAPKADAIADRAIRLSGRRAGAPSIDKVANADLQRKCAECAAEDKEVTRAGSARNPETEPEVAAAKRATAARNADDSAADEEVVTTNGSGALVGGVAGGLVGAGIGFLVGGPIGAGVGAVLGAGAGAALGYLAGGSSPCFVASGPTYTPSGTIPVTNAGGNKSALFSFAATFGTASDTRPPQRPACCEVRQYIKWNQAFQTWRGGPPHSGFPSSATYDTWYEDRDANDKRYGHRSGPYSDPIAGCGDEYKTGTARDQANGDTYCGKDSPGGPAALTGTYNFQLKVVDTCNGDAEKASSSIITINW